MSENATTIRLNDLETFCFESLRAIGMNERHAKITAEVLSKTDAFGTHSHGTKNLYDYIRKIKAGGITLNVEPTVVSEGPAFAIMDAHDAIGMVPAHDAMLLAMKKAAACGIGIVTVKNATHFGAAGYYANLAAQGGMFGICTSNVDPNMTIPGARSKVIGNNPFAYAAPGKETPSVFLDVALSSVASLKVVQAKKDGRSIPDTWIVGPDGLPTTDPSSYPDGCAMQPMAAHKGYGLAMMVDLLTGVLSGGACSMTGEIDSWLFNMEEPNHVCHTFIAVDVAQFVGEDAYRARVDHIGNILHDVPKAAGVDRVFLPGEIEWNKHAVAEANGLKLPEDVADSLKKLAAETGAELKLF